MSDYVISASILSADFARLGDEVEAVISAGVDYVHIDVMDNHYVPNLTFGPLVVKALRDFGITVPLDVHLMIAPIDRIIPDFAKAGASYITFHPEASKNIAHSLQLIHDHGCKAGLVFNPRTPLTITPAILAQLDIILLMSVNPGFSGQSFIPSVLNKLQLARKIINDSGRAIRLEIDGGIKIDNIRAIAAAGADTFVIGSGLFNSLDYQKTMHAIRKELSLTDR